MATHQEAGAPKETPAAPQDWLAQEEARAKGKIVEQERQNALDSKMQELERDREGQYSISVNDQWRICFRFVDGDAYEVEVTDYH